jgi:1-acyl-sn-glycerol-3-phosphate acyltransferase
MIIEAKHHLFIYPFFKMYALYKVRRNFNEVKITGAFEDKKLPVLLVSNHMSWWDGFWAMYLNIKVLHRKFHFMMLEEQLRRYSFFINTGGYSVRKGSRSIVETIDYTKRLLADNRNMVLLFPQGRITSVYDQSLKFEKGLDHILKNMEGKVHVVFLANLVDYLSFEKPTLYMYLREYFFSGSGSARPEEEYNRFYRECMDENIKRSE